METKTYGSITITKVEDGQSAYDTWLEQGNEGTKEEYLDSLKGETGRGIERETSLYYESTDDKTAPKIYNDDGELVFPDKWKLVFPDSWHSNTYFWTTTKIEWTDGTITYSPDPPRLISQIEAATMSAQLSGKSLSEWCVETNITIVDGSTIVSGSIDADKLQVNTLSAISANLGTVKSGILQSPGYMKPVAWEGASSVSAKTPSEGLAYILSTDGTYYSVSGVGTCTATDIVIPSAYNGIAVTQISTSAFSSNEKITSVTIPDSITKISWGAFWKCSNLKKVLIGKQSQLTYIGGYAFHSCEKLTSITIPSKVTDIKEFAFCNCYALEEVCYNAASVADRTYHHTATGTTEANQNRVFYDAGKDGDGIKVIIGSDVEKIPSYLFCPQGTSDTAASADDKEVYGTPKIVSVELENRDIPLTIGRDAFYGHYGTTLKEVRVPNIKTWCLVSFYNEKTNPLMIAGHLYCNDELVTHLIIPDGITKINDNAFRLCNDIISVTIPDSVTEIGLCSFNYCVGIKDIILGKGITKITYYAFNRRINDDIVPFDHVYYRGTKEDWAKINFPTDGGDHYNSPLTDAPRYYYSETEPTSDGNYWHYKDGFKISCNDNNMIESKHFKVTQEGDVSATSGDIAGWNIVSDAIYSDTLGAFSGMCSSYGYSYCTEGLRLELLGDMDSYVVTGYFGGDSDVYIPREYNGRLVTRINDSVFEGSEITSVVIPDGVESIGAKAFYQCNSLISVTFVKGSNCRIIGESAFSDCQELRSITLPDGLESVGESVFSKTNLVSIDLPDGCTKIDDFAFYQCSMLKNVVIPSSVTSIGWYAFYGCNNLTSALFLNTEGWMAGEEIISSEKIDNASVAAQYLKDRGAGWTCGGVGIIFELLDDNTYSVSGYNGSITNIIIPKTHAGKDVTRVGSDAFKACPSLTSVVISEGINSIGFMAFAGCKSLVSVTIPSSVSTIGERAFENCTALTSILIYNGVTEIALGMFIGCSSLMSITIPTSVINIRSGAFQDTSSLTTVFYCGTESEWKNVKVETNNDKLNNATIYYNMSCITNNDHQITSLVPGNMTSYPRFYAGWNGDSHIPTSDDTKFLVLEDGSLYASAAKIEGTVYATDGEFSGYIRARGGDIGGLRIDNGIKGQFKDRESFSLAYDGLVINNSKAKLSIGSTHMSYDETNKTTYFNTGSPLIIQGGDGDGFTSIELLNDPGIDELTFDTSLDFRVETPEDDMYHIVYIKLHSTKLVYTEIPYTIICNMTPTGIVGGYDYDSPNAEIYSENLSIPAGKSESEEKSIKIKMGFFGTRVRLKFDGGDWLIDDKVGNLKKTQNKTLESGIKQHKTKASILISGNIIPKSGNKYSLGSDQGPLWSVVYAQSTEISHSDKNKKNSIKNLTNNYIDIFDHLQPVSYKFNDNTSNRIHLGFIAQDVKEAILNSGLKTQDFAGYCEWTDENGETTCGLRYSEFIALCVDQIQKLKKRTTELENKNLELEERLARLEALINTTQND